MPTSELQSLTSQRLVFEAKETLVLDQCGTEQVQCGKD